ncbi:sulfurtransferase TusA family protein [Oceanobacillus sp. CAU 1775]
MDIKKTVDAKGLACPMPIVQTKKAIDTIDSGEILEVLATDKGSQNDIAAWVKSGGHNLLEQRADEDIFYFYIKKA